MNEKVIIENIQKQNSDYNNAVQARNQYESLILLSRDVFTEYIRFLFELIQNADDARATEIKILILDNHLVISHNGEAFNKEDVEGICNVGGGTKKSNSNATGYKGIGFKSVFGKSTSVSIFSNGFQFKFDEIFPQAKYPVMPWQIIPQWTDLPKLISDALDGKVWNVSTVICLDITEDLIADLKELLNTSQILLFLRSIKKISAIGKVEVSIEKKIVSSELVELTKNNSEKSNWIVRNIQDKVDETIKIRIAPDQNIPDKIKFAPTFDISFAAKVEKGKIVALNDRESLIFTYLPTKVKNFGFPFLLNSNFLADTSREKLHEDNAWNQWLMEIAGKKIVDWLAELSNSEFSLQILHLLPEQSKSTANKLTGSFFESFHSYSQAKPFVPNKGNILKTPNEIVIDETGLSNETSFITPKVLIDFINKTNEERKFKSDAFVHPKLESKGKLNSFGAYTFDLNNLEEFFVDDIFKKNHQPSQNFSLIKYFYDRDKYLNNKEYTEKLKSLPFIYAKGKKIEMRSPHQLMFPGIKDLESEVEDEILNSLPKIHKEVNQQIENNIEIKLWLEKLGVKESEQILEALLDNASEIVTEKNYKQITRFLFNQHRKGELESNYYKLANLKLYTTNNSFCEASSCYLSNFYEPTLEIQEYFAEGNYISHEYKEQGDLISEWKTFFIKIGVSETISWVIKSFNRYELSSKYPSYFAIIPSGIPNSMYGIKNDFYRYDMNVISFIELTNNYSFSKTFWEIIFKNNISHYSYKSDMGICYYPTSLTPFNDWIIKNLAIFPTTQKKCLVASEVFINSRDNIEIGGKYLPVFDCNLFPSDNWSDYLPFKKVFELDDYLQVIEAIESDTLKDEELKNINKKRLGLIYNKLKSLIPNLSAKKKNIISEWASSHKLLCDNGSFENANELKWVKIEGFTNTSEHLKTLFIPENCETNTDNFKELLQLFGVQIIDDFYVDPKEKVEEDSLRKQLLVILPYFTSIIERKNYEKQYSDEFSRLLKIINKTKFYKTSEIVLSFEIQTEVITGTSLYAYLDKGNDKHNLFYKNNWSNQITLFSLIPEILKLFNLTDLTEELKLLIQLNESEIKDWCLEQGYNVVNENITVAISKSEEEIVKISTNDNCEEEIKPSEASLLYDYSSIKTRISINEEAQEIIFNTLEDNGFIVDKRYNITYTILDGVLHKEKGKAIKVVVKSAKAGRIYFTPLEWLALSEEDSQLFVLTAGNKVRNITIENLQKVNDEFHMRFNTEMFVLSNLKILADFFKRLPYTHFIFVAPESTTDYLQQFGLSERNKSYEQLSDKDKQLYYSKDDDKTLH